MDIDPGSVVLPAGAPPAPDAAPAPATIQIDPGSVQLPEPPSILESVGRGALQGASMGFADEIAGAIGAATSKKTYTEARDESRAAFDLAKSTNPKAYLAGEVGGGFAGALAPGAVAGPRQGRRCRRWRQSRGPRPRRRSPVSPRAERPPGPPTAGRRRSATRQRT